MVTHKHIAAIENCSAKAATHRLTMIKKKMNVVKGNQLSIQDYAKYLGVTTEYLIDVFSELNKKGTN